MDLCDQLGQLPEVATDQHHTEEGQLADSRAGVVAIEEECKYSHFPLATAAANFPNEKASSFLNQKLGSNFSTFSFLEERKNIFFLHFMLNDVKVFTSVNALYVPAEI